MKDDFINLRFNIIRGDFVKGGEASSNVKKSLMQLGINNSVIKRVSVACYEAELNIVIHSSGGVLDVSIYEDRVTIVAEDTGPGIPDIDKAMIEGFSTASDKAREMGFGGGMGLPNMKRSSDLFKLESEIGKYTKVTMTIFFN